MKVDLNGDVTAKAELITTSMGSLPGMSGFTVGSGMSLKKAMWPGIREAPMLLW